MNKKMIKKYIEDGYEVNDRNKLVHREVVKKHEGRIKKGYHVHHCDGVKTNNDISNLVQIPAKLHAIIHKNYSFSSLPSKKYIEEVMLPSFLEVQANTCCPFSDACAEIKRLMSSPKKRKNINLLKAVLKKHFVPIQKTSNLRSSLRES